MRKSLCSVFFSGLLVGLAGCAATSPRIVKVGPPGALQEENSYAGEDLYLTEFAVRNKTSSDTKEKEAALRSQFVDFLRESAKFRRVIDATSGRVEIPADALKLKADFLANIEGGSISFMAAYYEAFLLFAISPRKGSAIIVGNATLMKRRKTISSKSWTSTQPFSYTVFGMFRTGPIQAAYKAAYEDVFNHVIVPVATESAPALSKEELRDLVKEGIKEASKKEEVVYHSDVDVPGYKAPENPSNYALVIGIENYSAVPKADFAERDAEAVRNHLLALGYPQRNIVYLTGSLGSKANIEKYIDSWLPSRVQEDSRLFVFFSGHGSPGINSSEAYLVPWDGDIKFLENTGYPLKRLYERLNALKAKKIVVALDSCFSGAGGRSVLPKGTRPLVSKIDTGTGSLGRLVVLSASDANEIAGGDDQQGHGVFTYFMLKGLNEKKGEATVKGLYDYLTPRVQDAARQQNRDQTPQFLLTDGDAGALSLRE